jgi:dienelactone hydrolase
MPTTVSSARRELSDGFRIAFGTMPGARREDRATVLGACLLRIAPARPGLLVQQAAPAASQPPPATATRRPGLPVRRAAARRRPGPPCRLGRLRAALLACALLACAMVPPGPGLAREADHLGALGLLWWPDQVAPARPAPLVVVLHDDSGVDPRGWLHGDQIRAAGIAVLHVELRIPTEDGPDPATAKQDAEAAVARLGLMVETIAQDPRFAAVPVGILAFGDTARAAALAAADPRHAGRIAALVLLYPGCAGLDAALGAAGRGPRASILLQHGDADPANLPAECALLERGLARGAPIRRLEYAGAGFAWDLRPIGMDEVRRLPWPGRTGERLRAEYWPEGAALAASRSASFFATTLSARRP